MNWLRLFFAPLQPFIAHPERIIAVATTLLVLFGVLGRTRGR